MPPPSRSNPAAVIRSSTGVTDAHRELIDKRLYQRIPDGNHDGNPDTQPRSSTHPAARKLLFASKKKAPLPSVPRLTHLSHYLLGCVRENFQRAGLIQGTDTVTKSPPQGRNGIR
jgi:hypothetical protein